MLSSSSTPIHPITGRHSLSPLSFTRCRIEDTLRCLYPEGRHWAYHVPCTYLCGLGPTYSPVVHRLRQTRQQRLILTTYLLVQAYQHLSLVNIHDVYQWFTYVDPTAPSWLPTALVLAITASTRAFAAIRSTDEATLFQELRTSPLPVTHVLVGYRWQNSG